LIKFFRSRKWSILNGEFQAGLPAILNNWQYGLNIIFQAVFGLQVDIQQSSANILGKRYIFTKDLFSLWL